ncbi:MAG: hypothetical protein ACOC29_02260 [Candidatus Sumerlaeota bacterium]
MMKNNFVCLLTLVTLLVLSGCSTYSRKEFAEENPVAAARQTRWSVNERPYEQAPWYEKAGRNFRDGTIGIVDDAFVGLVSAQIIIARTGFLTQKVAVFAGDVIGLADDNDVSEHVFKGILSRQFYRLGSRAGGMPLAVEALHEADWEYPEKTPLDYIGDKPFHHEIYFEPGAIPSVIAIALGDFMIRPAGNLLLIFSIREPALKIDEAGLSVIEAGLNIPFI